jgi:hypothetical protein
MIRSYLVHQSVQCGAARGLHVLERTESLSFESREEMIGVAQRLPGGWPNAKLATYYGFSISRSGEGRYLSGRASQLQLVKAKCAQRGW